MKKILTIIAAFMVISSCTTTKEARSAKAELRKENKLAGQEVVKQAVESKRFIIKFERLYFSYGRTIFLFPESNYIIIDGKKAIIRAGYIGRQYDIKPIAGINIRGENLNYESTNNTSKGIYEIKMKVNREANSFDVYLRIDKNGSCDVSLSSLKIDNVRYTGHLVPIKEKTKENTPQENNSII